MNISEAAQRTGLTAKALRHYDTIGLVTPLRSANGYREYSTEQLQELVFLAHSRDMGFSLDECGQLLGLYRNPGRASADVKKLATSKIQDLDRQLERLTHLRTSLQQWSEHCPGDASPHCPIINQLADPEETP